MKLLSLPTSAIRTYTAELIGNYPPFVSRSRRAPTYPHLSVVEPILVLGNVLNSKGWLAELENQDGKAPVAPHTMPLLHARPPRAMGRVGFHSFQAEIANLTVLQVLLESRYQRLKVTSGRS